MADITVKVFAGDDEEESRRILREFSIEAARLDGIVLRPQPRGDPITLGGIVLALITSGALKAFIEMITAYLSRNQHVEFEFASGGQTFRVVSPNSNLFEFEDYIRRLPLSIDSRLDRKVAVLVANDKFENAGLPDLLFTQNDAQEFQKILEDDVCGFETHLYTNDSSYNIRRDLDRICRGLKRDDTLLFYYAGHGKLDGSELCLITNDTTPDSLDATSLKAEQDVLKYFKRSYSKRKVMILDCCYADAVGDGARGSDLDSTLRPLKDCYGTYILTASSAAAYENDGHGIFTKALLDSFQEGGKDGNESLTIADISSSVQERLRASPQTPHLTILELEGDPIEIANFRQRITKRRVEETEKLVEYTEAHLNVYVKQGKLSSQQKDRYLEMLRLCDRIELPPQWLKFREDVVSFVKGNKTYAEVFEKTPTPEVLPDYPVVVKRVEESKPQPLRLLTDNNTLKLRRDEARSKPTKKEDDIGMLGIGIMGILLMALLAFGGIALSISQRH